MKKLLFILIGGALIAGGYFYLQRPPKFEGKYAGVHESIWKFTRTTDPKERLSIAIRLQVSMALSSLHPNEPMDLSEAEIKTVEEAKQLVNSTMQRVREFESHLTADDIAVITQDNPDSFFRYAGFFSTANQEKKCTKEQYFAIREKVGIRELLEKGTYVGPFVIVSDSRFHADYIQKAIELIKKDSRFADFQELADTYYPVGMEFDKTMKPSLQSLSGKNDDSRQKEYTEKLIAAGIEKSNVKDYAFKLAAQWPDCLGKISIEFFDFMKEDVTQTRGKFLLDKLREYIQTRGQTPEDISDLPVDKSDPVFGTTSDGWYNRFVLTKGDRGVKISSPGKDGKEGTDDDIFIGEVGKERSK